MTTLYDDEVFDEKDKSALRKKINDAWKEVYYQLGRNKSVPLSDDDFLRAHWIIYFRYSRKRGDDYIKFLLSKFSSKGIFEKAPVLVETEAESVISDDVTDADDTEVTETEEQEIIEVSKLQPKEIEDYVNSLKDMAKYWYDTYFPFESANLTPEEQNESIGLTVSASDISDRWLLRSSVGGIFLRTAELKSLKQLSALSLLHFAWVILMHPMAAVIIIELRVRCM